ncbi:MAG: hypothetical protein KGL62_13650 [Bradyrhizobium sp.]|uniref:hypothetical protein n=1 Tax=Bradyrhizobium sp. TaxID=376 RepID=UPI00238B7820|nr:hypothetical protein [Bradyrhizobium sp.]MDE2603394.1 hypothetical protein [Bradyrhizobium sp.]
MGEAYPAQKPAARVVSTGSGWRCQLVAGRVFKSADGALPWAARLDLLFAGTMAELDARPDICAAHLSL